MIAQYNVKPRGPILSVTCVAVSIATMVISIAVAIILAVTLTYSLRAADEFAESYSQNSVSAAQNKVNDFVTTPVEAYTQMKTGTDFDILHNVFSAPATPDRLQMYEGYLDLYQTILYGASFQLLYVAAGLSQGSWISCSIDSKTTRAHTCMYSDPFNNTAEWKTSYYTGTGDLLMIETYEADFDPRSRPWYINAPKSQGDKAMFSTVYIDNTFAVPVVDLNGPLFAKDGTFMGVTSITLDLRQIATFLANMPRTTNGFTALVDAEGFMLGGSDLGLLSSATPFNVVTDGALPAGCEQYTNDTDGAVSKVCRLSPATYDNAVLRELATKEPTAFFNDGSSFTRKIKLSGEQWMVSKAPITAKTDVTEATISWQIFTLMPVSDVTGPITDGRNAGIAVACVMVVVSCLASGLALFVLLNPLSVLSLLVERVAELKDDSLGATMDKSSMREIRAIQDSFERLSAQLKKAKSFLPASLLAQLESSDDSCLSDDEENVDVFTAGGTATDAMTAVSGSRRKGFRADTYSQTTTTNSTTIGRKVISSNVSLAHRSVTICSLNLRNFHRHANNRSTGFEGSYGKLVDEYQRIAKEHRGIMDSFHGDRFTFTFNTVRPCAAHASMAATAMLKIVASMEHHAAGSTSVMGSAVTCGVATGRCLVGNLGSDKAKRYSVIGPAFSHATVLERLCKRYPNTSVLLSAETSKDCETHIGLLYMDVIDGPGRKAVPIAAAKYQKEVAKDNKAASGEWMYEMAMVDIKCDYHNGNSSFLSALNGDVSDAQRDLLNFNNVSEEADFARNRINELIQGKGCQSAELGTYYDVCVLEEVSSWDEKCDNGLPL